MWNPTKVNGFHSRHSTVLTYCPQTWNLTPRGVHTGQHGDKSYHAQITKDDLPGMDMEDDIENFSFG